MSSQDELRSARVLAFFNRVDNPQDIVARIHDDPRWSPFLESIGRSPEQLAAIKFEVTLPE